MDRRCATVVAALLAALASPLAAQDTRVRVDFEGSAARPAPGSAPAPYAPGPRARIDFEGSAARTAVAGPAYAPGPRARIDFEGRASASGPRASEPPPPASPGTPGPRMARPPGAMPAASAFIASVAPIKCVAPNGIVTIDGQGFGTQPGKRHFALIGKQPMPLSTRNWSDTRVTATLPAGAMPGLTYPLVLNDATGRAISNADRRLAVCR